MHTRKLFSSFYIALLLLAVFALLVAAMPASAQGDDCIPYNPNTLEIVDEGATGWLLTDGSSRMLVLDNRADAEAALALARQHTEHCFIGRDNTRSNRQSYIMKYWQGDSGISATIPNPDCLPYDPNTLEIVNEGASGWLLTDGSSRMVILDDQADAEAALRVAQQHTQHCFIGRGNNRPNRQSYIVEYWQGEAGPTNATVVVTLVTGTDGTQDIPVFELAGDFTNTPYRVTLDQPNDLQPGTSYTYTFTAPAEYCALTGYTLRKPAGVNGDDAWELTEIYIEIDGETVFFDRAVGDFSPVTWDSFPPNGGWSGTADYQARCGG